MFALKTLLKKARFFILVTHPDLKSNTDFKQIPLSFTSEVANTRDADILTNIELKEMVEQFAFEAKELVFDKWCLGCNIKKNYTI